MIELITLQSIGSRVVVESEVVCAVFVIALCYNTAYSTTCSYPHVMVLIFCNATDIIVAESLFLC